MRITSKGQVTIPVEIRESLGFLPETEVTFRVEGNAVRLVKVDDSRGDQRGARIVRNLRGRADLSMTTDEILARRTNVTAVLVDQTGWSHHETTAGYRSPCYHHRARVSLCRSRKRCAGR